MQSLRALRETRWASTQATENLRTFRRDLHDECMRRRADALFERTDAVLTAGLVPSPPHLSLAPVHRRGWCSLYAALAKERIDDGDVRELLARYPLAEGGSLVYAVDVRTNTPTISQEAFRTICRTKGRTSENSVKRKFGECTFYELR